MSFDSRITGGDISLLVDQSLVERVGFVIISFYHNFAPKNPSPNPNRNRSYILELEDKADFLVLQLNRDWKTRLSTLSNILQREKLYLAHATISLRAIDLDNPDHVEHAELGSADLYKERESIYRL